MDCSLPGSSVHGIFQARISEWVASLFKIALLKGKLWQLNLNFLSLGMYGQAQEYILFVDGFL